MKNKSIEDLENLEVRKEIFKLLEIFEEGFLNSELELVICHPINPVDIADDFIYRRLYRKGKNVYCNVYFNAKTCQSKLDVQRKVIEYWSRDAYKTQFAGEEVSEIIQDYIRQGINEYLKTDFDRDDMELIYTYLGNGINSKLCEEFIKNKFNLDIIRKYAEEKR